MKYLQIYEKFTKSNEVLWIFDFDDTLVNTPSFEDLAIDYLKENVTISDLLDNSIKLINRTLKDLKIENGRLYIDDPNMQIIVKGNWVRKKSRVYLITPDKFNFSDLSLPKNVKKLSDFYNSVDNKAIVTGRMESMRSKIINILDDFNLDKPNHGLYCFPNNGQFKDGVAVWKANTIIKLIRSTGFDKIKFYDDNSKWLSKIDKIIKSEMPHIDYVGIKAI